jgi:DNA-directed RNA polymerase specialized sigma24 family protein
MNANDNYGKQNHIYDKQTRTWFEVTPEQYEEYDRWRTRIRKREQYHKRCMCPRSKWWLCDGMCQDCEFHAPGDTISLDAPVTNEDGDEVTLADTLMDPDSLFVSAMCDREELSQLLARLDELMPEAREIGRLRQKGWTDEAIANALKVKRTTFLSRLKKAQEKLASEFPDRF